MEFPLNADGECMKCKEKPKDSECIYCSSCVSPWHIACLLTFNPVGGEVEGKWSCPDCVLPVGESLPAVRNTDAGGLAAKAREIEANESLSMEEKARMRQQLFTASDSFLQADGEEGNEKKDSTAKTAMDVLDEKMNCAFCLQLVDRPVTTPCGHNFCLKCFQKWVGQGKRTCAKCRSSIPPKMASLPRINAALVVAIRLAKAASHTSRSDTNTHRQQQPHPMANKDRPITAFRTERAVKTGKANACSGRIFVTIPSDHFGPITAEHDPDRQQGVLVGETWEDRMECRQWGAHFPHVAGIAGQSDHGAQSVALSGGYEDDMDMGEYFLYTGSGGRDLSGNKRTNKEHSFDQKFEGGNESLRVSCRKGYPVRVVRSHKEKRSSYAPESGVRYDGIYRIEMCWRKKGAGGHLVCRYLFVRCDNEPAPWTSDEHGDRPRPLPSVEELKEAKDITSRKGMAAWDWIVNKTIWGWTCQPPASRKLGNGGTSRSSVKKKQVSMHQKLLKEFGCSLCGKVLNQPVSTPCGHNFCKLCLESRFGSEASIRHRSTHSGKSLRSQKVARPCPAARCGQDIADMASNLKVNLEMVDVIETLKKNAADEEAEIQNGEEENRGVDALPVKKKGKGECEEDGIKAPTIAAESLKDVEGETGDIHRREKEDKMRILKDKFPGFDVVVISQTLDDESGSIHGALSTLKRLKRSQDCSDRKGEKRN